MNDSDRLLSARGPPSAHGRLHVHRVRMKLTDRFQSPPEIQINQTNFGYWPNADFKAHGLVQKPKNSRQRASPAWLAQQHAVTGAAASRGIQMGGVAAPTMRASRSAPSKSYLSMNSNK